MASLIRTHGQLGDSVLAARIDSKNQFSIGPNGEYYNIIDTLTNNSVKHHAIYTLFSFLE